MRYNILPIEIKHPITQSVIGVGSLIDVTLSTYTDTSGVLVGTGFYTVLGDDVQPIKFASDYMPVDMVGWNGDQSSIDQQVMRALGVEAFATVTITQ